MAGSARTIVRLRPGRTRRRRRGSRARLLAASIAAPLALLLGPGGAGAAITEFPVPTADSLPAGIAAGPDGALWFTESAFSVDPGRIGRITTTGTIGEVPVPPTGIPTRPFAITPGPDGALWFTQPGQFRGGGQIGRITTAGAISEFFGGSAPEDIAAGPDGALWVTDPANGAIERITTGGAFSAIGVGFPFSRPSGIAAGPDGALWFTDPGTERHRADHDGGRRHQVPAPDAGQRAVRDHGGARRGALVHGGRRRQRSGGSPPPASSPSSRSRRPAAGPPGSPRGPTGRSGSPRRPATGSGGSPPRAPRPSSRCPRPPAGPPAIAAGPDGALWFTEASGNRIGRIAAAPTSKEQCRNGGWRTFPAFKNQGQCVAFVARGR